MAAAPFNAAGGGRGRRLRHHGLWLIASDGVPSFGAIVQGSRIDCARDGSLLRRRYLGLKGVHALGPRRRSEDYPEPQVDPAGAVETEHGWFFPLMPDGQISFGVKGTIFGESDGAVFVLGSGPSL